MFIYLRSFKFNSTLRYCNGAVKHTVNARARPMNYHRSTLKRWRQTKIWQKYENKIHTSLCFSLSLYTISVFFFFFFLVNKLLFVVSVFISLYDCFFLFYVHFLLYAYMLCLLCTCGILFLLYVSVCRQPNDFGVTSNNKCQRKCE